MIFRSKSRYAGRICLLCLILTASVFFTVYSDITSDSAMNALQLCAISVIPSLFPFMVLSALASRAASHLTESRSKRTAVILPVFLGALCGFPVGAACTAAMYRNGALSKNKAEYLCALCNNTGPAFVVGVIGRTFWKSSSVGWMFYICQLLSAAIVFGVWRLFFGKRIYCGETVPICENDHHRISTLDSGDPIDNFCRGFCNSVGESALSVVQICGYIVFFKVICDTVKILLPTTDGSALIYTMLSAVLEFTSGSSASAEIGGNIGVAICGFSLGFSGLSVMAQSAGILSKSGLNARPLFILKIFIGILCSLLSCMVYNIADFPEAVFSGTDIMIYTSPAVSAAILLALIPAMIIPAIRKNRSGE